MPNNEPTNTKRATTLSAPTDPRIDPRRKASKDEADKVRHALSELRKRNTELSADIHSLETAIGEPAFRRLIDQVTSAESSLAISSEPSSSTEDLKRQKIAQCKKVLGPKLSKLAGKGQTLHFGAVNPQHCLPRFFIAINSENRKLTAVSIVGPPDIKKRSSGALRVADEALSLDRSLISDLINKGQLDQQQTSTTKKNLQQAPHNGDNQLPQSAQSSRKRSCVEAAAERARNRVESALARAAEQQPPLVVFGVLRRDAKIMAVHNGTCFSHGMPFAAMGSATSPNRMDTSPSRSKFGTSPHRSGGVASLISQHPWEATKRLLLAAPLRLRSRLGTVVSRKASSTSSQSFSEDPFGGTPIWRLRDAASKPPPQFESALKPSFAAGIRGAKVRRRTESPRGLRRSVRDLRRRRRSGFAQLEREPRLLKQQRHDGVQMETLNDALRRKIGTIERLAQQLDAEVNKNSNEQNGAETKRQHFEATMKPKNEAESRALIGHFTQQKLELNILDPNVLNFAAELQHRMVEHLKAQYARKDGVLFEDHVKNMQLLLSDQSSGRPSVRWAKSVMDTKCRNDRGSSTVQLTNHSLTERVGQSGCVKTNLKLEQLWNPVRRIYLKPGSLKSTGLRLEKPRDASRRSSARALLHAGDALTGCQPQSERLGVPSFLRLEPQQMERWGSERWTPLDRKCFDLSRQRSRVSSIGDCRDSSGSTRRDSRWLNDLQNWVNPMRKLGQKCVVEECMLERRSGIECRSSVSKSEEQSQEAQAVSDWVVLHDQEVCAVPERDVIHDQEVQAVPGQVPLVTNGHILGWQKRKSTLSQRNFFHNFRTLKRKLTPSNNNNNNNRLAAERLSRMAANTEQDELWMEQRQRRKECERQRIVELTGDWVQVQIVHLPNVPEGLGFGIVGGHSTGVVVKSLIRGSVADKDMRLRPGDRILQIGHISTQGLNSQQVAALLRQQNAVVQLTVVRPIQLQDSDQDTPLCWTMSTRAALSADTLDEEVQARLEAFAKSRNKSCNGLHHHPKCAHGHAHLNQQNISAVGAAETISEGTEYPDQLALHHHHYNHQTTTTTTENTADAMMDTTNQPSTSTAGMQNECGGSHGHQIWAQSADKIGPTELLNSVGNTTSSSSRRRRGRTSRGPSNDNPSCSSSSDRLSLKQLQEMALTSFCRDKWTPGKFREIQIELERDKHIGLGITVAGYVYKKEEISGVFIKSLVPQSSAHLSRQIQLHDLIVEVNGRRLEGLSHAESVRTLIRSGQRVRLKLIRFEEGTPQAKCLKMLHEQELAAASQIESAGSSITAATVLPIVQTQQQYEQSLVDYKSYWATRLGPEYDIVLVDVRPDERVIEDGGLGIEWQGTVDICDGSQLCSHHFIESMRKDGPAAKTGALKAGDELLQVNETALFGESFVRVRNELNSAQKSCQFVRLIFCRRAEKEHINFVMPSSEQSLPLAYPILATMMALDEHFIKAKSELRLADLASAAENGPSTTVRCRTASAAAAASRWKRSRSLENLSGFAVWHCVPIVVTLRKDAKGLGFSVADYQDPSHPAERVIVIRSLVPGGAAQADGRIVPGDRLLFVNGEDLSSSSLERAVEVLKAAPIGQIVRLGIAKPVPIEQDAKGLGFSVADYQDPSHPAERVIVIRSLVPGGAAQADDKKKIKLKKVEIVPGDRLLFVNGEDLSSSSLERAVEVLKAAPIGQIVRLGIAKPVPIEQCRLDDTVPLISHSERLLAKSHSPRGRRRREPFGDHLLLNAQRHSLITSNPSSACSSQEEIWVGGHLERSLNPQLYFPSTADSRCSPLASPQSRLSSGMQTTTAWSPCSSRSLSPCASPASSLKGSWSYDITNLPSHLERHIKVLKTHLPLGVVLDANVDKAINGCVVKSICSKKALAKDGRIQPVDHIVKVNGESLRNVTNAQARAIMRRANLVGAQCGISYITSSDAKLWKERFQRGIVEMGNLTDGTTANAAEQLQQQQQQQQQDQLQSRLSPKVYPKFYRSPILDVPFESLESFSTSADTIAAVTVVQVENFVDKLLKSIFADAMFDVYILDRPDLQARHTVRPNRSASVAIEAAAVVEMATVSMPTTTRRASMVQGLIRTASSSLKRKTHRPTPPTEEHHRQIEKTMAAASTSKISPVHQTMGPPNAEEAKQFSEIMPEPAKAMNFWSEPRAVTLNRVHNETFGISIVGGRVEVSQRADNGTASSVPICGSGTGPTASSKTVSGIFIKSVVPDSPAGRSGQLFMGDRVLAVNDSDLTNTTHEHAVQVIKSAKNPVKFMVQSLQSLQAFVPSSSTKQSIVEVAEVGGTSGAAATFAIDLDPDSAAALERLEDDVEAEDAFRYTESKVVRKYAHLPGHPVLIRLRDIPRGGLGLILSARGSPLGAQNAAAIVVGVKSDSPLSLNVGDELLEVCQISGINQYLN
uniref:PDZ domain-containing protein n=1 Tax=Globodera pallida TaxID=36090 RepID=A0A183CBW9_GLOPA